MSDENKIKRVINKLPDERFLYDLSDFFRIFGDTTRIKILYSLFESELCVQDIAKVLNMNQSAISHQLRMLKNFKLVKQRREGKTIYYSLDDEHIEQIIDLGTKHLNE